MPDFILSTYMQEIYFKIKTNIYFIVLIIMVLNLFSSSLVSILSDKVVKSSLHACYRYEFAYNEFKLKSKLNV